MYFFGTCIFGTGSRRQEGLLRKTEIEEKREKKREFRVRVLAGVWEGKTGEKLVGGEFFTSFR